MKEFPEETVSEFIQRCQCMIDGYDRYADDCQDVGVARKSFALRQMLDVFKETHKVLLEHLS